MYFDEYKDIDLLELYKKYADELKQEAKEDKEDMVNHPSHYNTGEIEVIDYIKDKLDDEGYEAYCIGNVIKYVSRYKHKGGKQDLEKAFTYLRWAIEVSK